MKVTFVWSNGEKTVEGKAGETLLELAERNDVPLEGNCAGSGVCGSCHVKIDKNFLNKLELPSEDEEDVLDRVVDLADNSRLACMVKLNKNLEGIKVVLQK